MALALAIIAGMFAFFRDRPDFRRDSPQIVILVVGHLWLMALVTSVLMAPRALPWVAFGAVATAAFGYLFFDAQRRR